MVIERVPLLNMRPRHLIKVYSTPASVPFDAYTANLSDLIKDLGDPIGGIQSLKITSSRDLNVWRELNYETLGRIMEVYPSLGEFEVAVEKIAFFTNHLLDAFKAVEKGDIFSTAAGTTDKVGASFNIYNQIAPIHIIVELLDRKLENNQSQETTLKVLIYDCWFDKSEIEFDVTDNDLAIVQEATLTAAGIYVARP